MKTQKFTSRSPEETINFGEYLAERFNEGDIVCFFGDLGSGKTTFQKALQLDEVQRFAVLGAARGHYL